jgi:hypothetical protein
MNDVCAHHDCVAPVGPLHPLVPVLAAGGNSNSALTPAGSGPQSDAQMKHLLDLVLYFTMAPEVLIRFVP